MSSKKTPGGSTVHLVCPYCAKEFNGNASTSGVRSNYRRHLLTHTGERPYVCTYCSDAFGTSSNLRRHVLALHPQQLTPTNGPQETAAEAEANDCDTPLAELVLPTATTNSIAAPRQKRRKSRAEGNAEDIQAADVDATAPPKPAVTFICEDCELEVSSRPKLNRHRRYYCPFRDNIFTDPVQDAVDRYRVEQELQQQQHDEVGPSSTVEDAEDGGLVSSGGTSVVAEEAAAAAAGGSGGDPSAPSDRRRRQRAKRASTLALTEGERTYLARVAAESGLKFVEDAYMSDRDSDSDNSFMADMADSPLDASVTSLAGEEDGGEEEDDTVVRSPSRTPRGESAQSSPHPKPTPSPAHPSLSPRGTPLHGPLPPPGKLASPSLPPLVGRKDSAKELHVLATAAGEAPPPATASHSDGSADEAEDGVDPAEDLLHLHFHRRGSGRRRERHILQRRLRAQEGALLSLTNSPLRRPHKQQRRETADRATAPVTRPQPPIVVSDEMMARAAGLWSREPGHGVVGGVAVTSEHVCPYCDDYTSFANARLLTAHTRRMHPVEAARDAARATEPGAANNDDGAEAPP